jgi:Fe2+ transport system protein FeoA
MSKTLSHLKPGESGIVKKVHGCGAITRRIVDMGVIAGTRIDVKKFAPLGDPIEVKLKGFNMSLRKTEADLIEIEPA